MMALRYFNPDEVIVAARSALRPRLLITMVATLMGVVVIYGVFSIGEHIEFSSILLRFIGGVSCLLWTLFGLTTLAHQIAMMHEGGDIPDPFDAAGFAWKRISSLLTIPAWGAGMLLLLLLAEMLVVVFARIPGLGGVWLALVAMPLLLLNTLVALALLLALFNIAVRVALSPQDSDSMRDTLWRLMRTRFPELLIYNLGGVLATSFVAAVVLSPLWLGWRITHGLVGYVAGGTMHAVIAATGFWASVAHIIGLVMVGLLVAAVASVPCIVITHLTLMIHKELDAGYRVATQTTEEEKAVDEEKATAPKRPRRARSSSASKVIPAARSKAAPKPRKPRAKKASASEKPAPKSE